MSANECRHVHSASLPAIVRACARACAPCDLLCAREGLGRALVAAVLKALPEIHLFLEEQ